MQTLRLDSCSGLTGDIGTLILPEGMQYLWLSHCSGLTGKAKDQVTSKGYTLQAATHRPSFLTVSFFLFFTSPSPQVISANSSSPQACST